MRTETGLILAIDTSTRLCGLCLYSSGEVIAEDSWHSAQTHTVETMPAVSRMLARAGVRPEQLDGVVAGLGPGSFTGLRIGLSIAKGLASALHVPLVGICTLDAVALAHAERRLPMLAATLAGRGRFCAARYTVPNGKPERVGDFQVLPREKFTLDPSGRTLFCGELNSSDTEYLREQFQDQAVIPSSAGLLRRPAYLAELGWARLARGEADDPATLSPVYIRTTPDEKSA
jgi:tRNA threonylcarbamoyladenosine biosynthesis protein TsaB